MSYWSLVFENFSKELTIVITSALPISELRGTIPLAILKFNFPWWKTFPLAIFGNILPIIPLLFLLGPISSALSKFKIGKLFFNWLFNHTRRKSKIIEKYKSLGLMIFVAIPLPLTGAWTGAIASFLFGIRFKSAFIAIFLGILVAGTIVTTLTMMGIIGAIIVGIVFLGLVGSNILFIFRKQKKTGCSAVGFSALASGARGHGFKSPHPDSLHSKDL